MDIFFCPDGGWDPSSGMRGKVIGGAQGCSGKLAEMAGSDMIMTGSAVEYLSSFHVARCPCRTKVRT